MLQIDAQQVAAYIIDVADFDERFEDDCFVVDMFDVRWYVERRKRHFVLHVGAEVFKLPRC